MPIKPPGAYDYYCHHCNHQFRQRFWRRLLGLRALPFAVCPKCSHLAVRFIY